MDRHACHRRIDCAVIERKRLSMGGDRRRGRGGALGPHGRARLDGEYPAVGGLVGPRAGTDIEHRTRTAERRVNTRGNPRIRTPIARIRAPVPLIVNASRHPATLTPGLARAARGADRELDLGMHPIDPAEVASLPGREASVTGRLRDTGRYMSHANVEVVQRVMRHFADEDIEAAFEDIDPEAMLDWSNSDAPDSGVYTGHAAWRAFAQARDEALGERRFDSAEVIAPASDTVVLVGRIREQGRASGVEVEARGAAVWTLRDGKVICLKLYQTRDEALKAVGLEG